MQRVEAQTIANTRADKPPFSNATSLLHLLTKQTANEPILEFILRYQPEKLQLQPNKDNHPGTSNRIKSHRWNRQNSRIEPTNFFSDFGAFL
jgi:hypothetical protein